MDQIDPSHDLKQFAKDMVRAAVAWRCHVDFTWIGFGIGDKFRNGLRRKRWRNQDNKRSLGYARDRCDIPDEIEIQIRVECRVHRIGRGGLEGRITVGRSSCDIFGGDVAAEAWSVLDYEWLTEPLGQPWAQEASDDVWRAACVKRDDHIDRTRRITLRPCNLRQGR